MITEATIDEMRMAVSLSEQAFPAFRHDHEAIAEIHRWARNIAIAKQNGIVVGSAATLFLTADGLTRLLAGTFPDFVRPPFSLLATPDEAAAGAYIWFAIAPKHGRAVWPEYRQWVSDRAPGTKLYARAISGVLSQLYLQWYQVKRVPGTELLEFPDV